MRRKPGDVNYTVGYKTASIAAQIDGQLASAVSPVAVSTMNSWIKNRHELSARPSAAAIYERALDPAVTPVVAWIENRLRARGGQNEVSFSRVMAYVKENHAGLLGGKSYHSQRRTIDRAMKAAWKRVFGYESISPSIGDLPVVQGPTEMCNCSRGCGAKCQNRVRMIECSRTNCKLFGACANRLWKNGMAAPVLVWIGDTGVRGRGLFAGESLKKGILVREYVGELISRETMEARFERGRNEYVMELTADKFIDASGRGNHSRMINHDCKPNAQAQVWTVRTHLRLGIFTTKPIRVDEEITISYGEDFVLDSCQCSTCASV